MKRLLTTAALAALFATPVLAQTDRPTQRARAETPQTQSTQAQQQRRAVNRSQDVYDIRGHYVGSDPDPTIRAQLARDPQPAD
jgi:Ni/Co efflux regulator RcnB